MKSAYTLVIIAAICNSAIGLDNGLYKIGSTVNPSQVLKQSPLHFAPASGEITNDEVWKVSKAEKDSYYSITSYDGAYINSDSKPGSQCYLGQRSQEFIAEFQGETKYQLVESGSGYLLRETKDGVLEIAEYDTAPNEIFTFVAVNGR